MSVIKVLRDLDRLFNYSTDENPTSQQDYQEAVKNWVKTIVSLVDAVMWQPETEYTVGSQLLTPSLPYYVLRCTVAGTSGAAEPDYTDVALGDEITDGTVTWVVDGYLPLSGGTLTGVVNGVTPTAGDNSTKIATTEFVNAKAGLPVGFEYFQTNPNVPAGSLPLLGGEYSRTTYADLWAWVQTQNGYLLEESAWKAKAAANGGNVPFYSKGDGSTTFRVPALNCWVRGANSISEVGGYLAAGLPNITGGFTLETYFNKNGTGDGAFHINLNDPPGNGITTGDGARNYAGVTFNASRCSAIYGASDTVQPESIVGLWVVKAYGTVTNVGSTDVANISTGLTQAETRISALKNDVTPPAGVVQAFAGRTMPQGWLLCDGSAVSRTDYAALYAVIGTTYGAGNGSTTFNLPNLVDKFVEGSATAGTVKSAGLPNITGGRIEICAGAEVAAHTRKTADNGNALYPDGGWARSFTVSELVVHDDWTSAISLDASRSNSIYGNSTTVQPPALTMRYIIKY